MIEETIPLKDGRSVLIRGPRAGDGELVREYLSNLGASTDFVLSFPGDIRPASAYEEHVEMALRGEFYSLSAIHPDDGSIIASTAFMMNTRVKTAHIATLGTGVLPGWQGAGLGKWMLDRAVKDIKANPKILKLELGVIKGNDIAQRMYERAGFEVEGCKLKSIKQPSGVFDDEILMGMWVGDEVFE